jgi:hypothetical protein
MLLPILLMLTIPFIGTIYFQPKYVVEKGRKGEKKSWPHNTSWSKGHPCERIWHLQGEQVEVLLPWMGA